MTLDEARQLLEQAEPDLKATAFLPVYEHEREGRRFHLVLTARFHRQCRKGRVWKSRAMLTALKNVAYGFDPIRARSRGGQDGIFLLARDFQPKNDMMRKVFDRFLDKLGSGAQEVADRLGTRVEDLHGARLVSHHMRLLGLLWQDDNDDWLVLIDYDDSGH